MSLSVNKVSLVLLSVFIWGLVGSLPLYGQDEEFSVSGTVIDAQNGDPLPGGTVLVKGTTIGTTTDLQGTYQITAPSASDTLRFSFVGYSDEEVAIDGQSTIDVELSPSVDQLGELVVVGYGEERPQRVTGSVSSVDPADLVDQPSSDVTSRLQGRISGVEVVSNGGQPARSPSLRIRGTGTVNDADPLVVVDGFPVGRGAETLENIDPGSIESIEVLKDAASAAIYGNRGANGVVMVTTRSGNYEQDLGMTFRSTIGVTTPRNIVDVLEAPELAELKRERYINDGIDVAPIWEVDSLQVQRTNWQEELLETGDSGFQQYELSISNGTENASFIVSGNYMTERGMIKNAYSDRLGLRLNSNYLFDNFLGLGDLEISQRFLVSRTEQQDIRAGNPAQNGIYFSAIRFHPGLPVKWDNGEYSSSQIHGEFGDINNPIFTVNEAIDGSVSEPSIEGYTAANSILSNVSLNYSLLDNLSVRARSGIDYRTERSRGFQIIIDEQIRQQTRNWAQRTYSQQYSVLGEGFLHFEDTFGRHDVGLLAGGSFQSFETDDFGAERSDYTSEDPSQRVLDAGQSITGAFGTRSDDGLVSGINRLNYSFDDRYILTASVRADASSRFSEENRWGYFPAVSGRWRVSEEEFFQDWTSLFSTFALKGGWGRSGNQSVDRLQYIGLYTQGSRVYFGGERLTGVNLARLPNRDISWETVETLNAAVDMGFLNDRLTTRLEVWRRDTRDMLLAPPTIGASGTAELPDVNVGAVRNQGIDVDIDYEQNVGEVGLRISGNASFLQNEVLDINEDFLASRTYGRPNVEMARTFEGHPIATFYGWKADGLYQTQAEIDNDPGLADDPRRDNIQPGDVRFIDINGDGRIDGDDRTILGSPHPDVTYGLNIVTQYSDFDLSLFFTGSAGVDIFNADRMQGLNPTYPFNMYEEALDRWHGEGTSNTVPRMSTRRTNRNFRASDKWVESGDYLKLKTVTLGYSAPEEFLNIVGLSDLRLHATVQNAFTLTPYSGRDPELGYTDGNLQRNVDFAQYPHGRTWTIGSVVRF